MKADKEKRAPHIIMMTKRFNDVSRLVASEILNRKSIAQRVSAIEKWAAVADIARCLHNFNGVLQICSAFTNTAVFRLKKTWEKVSKTVSFNITNRFIIYANKLTFNNASSYNLVYRDFRVLHVQLI